MKKKVIILYNKLFHYRIPIFNMLSELYDLTVAYSENDNNDNIKLCNFNCIYIPTIKIWKFIIHKNSINKICKDYDVVIALGQSNWLSYSTLAFIKKRKYKLIFWSIGVPASYNRKYGDANRIHYLFNDIFNARADGLIFYSERPIKIYKKNKYKSVKMFVANNTVKIKKIEINSKIKNNILFIGTLYLEKGLDILLESYLKAYRIDQHIPELHIVGDGKEYNKIKNWIDDNKLSKKVILLGPIYDEDKKAEIFSESIACISPLQAGLSVLESMGYGVPFITVKDAITGGESFNIINNINGVILKDTTEITNIILDIKCNKHKYIKYGIKSYQYYWEKRKPNDMAREIAIAIDNI